MDTLSFPWNFLAWIGVITLLALVFSITFFLIGIGLATGRILSDRRDARRRNIRKGRGPK